jgi:hypothetical protein
MVTETRRRPSFLKKRSKKLLIMLSLPALKKFGRDRCSFLFFLSAASLNIIFLVLFFQKRTACLHFQTKSARGGKVGTNSRSAAAMRGTAAGIVA